MTITDAQVEAAAKVIYGTAGVGGRVVTMSKADALITARLALIAASQARALRSGEGAFEFKGKTYYRGPWVDGLFGRSRDTSGKPFARICPTCGQPPSKDNTNE